MKKSIFLTMLFGLFLLSTAIADPGDTLWTRTYGGTELEYGRCVQQTSDGGYAVAGYTRSFGAGGHDLWLLKTDANGDTLWTRTYGGAGWDEAWSVQQTSDGGYILAGATMSFGPGEAAVYLVKTDANGDTLWTRTYGRGLWDEAWSVQQTSDGGYIIAGFTESWATLTDVYLVKTDANGDSLWTRTYGGTGPTPDYGCSVQQTSDGAYITAGFTESFGGGIADFYLVKTDANGDSLWARTYGGTYLERSYSVQQTSDGGYILAGETEDCPPMESDTWVVKTDADGNMLWTRRYDRGYRDCAECIQQTADGGYILAGNTRRSLDDPVHVYLVRTKANGDTLWTRTYGGTDSDGASCIRQTTDGAYIASGWRVLVTGQATDLWLLRVAGASDIAVEIVPDHPPVTVPQGGSFGFMGTLTNNTEETQVVDAWTMAVGPQKDLYGPFKLKYHLELAPLGSLSAHFSQYVPCLAPLGFYDYIAYCGDYPSTVMDSSFFQVEVVEGVGSSQEGWVLTGSFLEGDLADVPSEFALLSNYPNPFNASTVIEYQLPTSSSVKLEVYNLRGQKVATLADETQQAGYRAAIWDASEVSSGVYFYKLTAGDLADTRRMILLK